MANPGPRLLTIVNTVTEATTAFKIDAIGYGVSCCAFDSSMTADAPRLILHCALAVPANTVVPRMLHVCKPRVCARRLRIVVFPSMKSFLNTGILDVENK